MRKPQVFFDFYCPAKTIDDAEIMTIARIPASFRTEESAVQTMCWFDYRHLHPYERTFLWAHHYVEAVKACYAATRDIVEAETIKPFKSKDLGAELTSAWLARQKCDRFGMRYEFVLRSAMTRFADRGWGVMPRPNQLYGEELVLDMRDAWDTLQNGQMQFPAHPRFLIENYEGHPDQKDWLRYLTIQVQRRAKRPALIASVVARGYLTLDMAASLFGRDRADAAARTLSLLVSHS